MKNGVRGAVAALPMTIPAVASAAADIAMHRDRVAAVARNGRRRCVSSSAARSRSSTMIAVSAAA